MPGASGASGDGSAAVLPWALGGFLLIRAPVGCFAQILVSSLRILVQIG
ncbi:hypothetical protein N4G58_11275 [Edwardsiella piscicida]|nr:hypothetical protein N4G58_11275 [Edwardsiella piscicida]